MDIARTSEGLQKHIKLLTNLKQFTAMFLNVCSVENWDLDMVLKCN